MYIITEYRRYYYSCGRYTTHNLIKEISISIDFHIIICYLNIKIKKIENYYLCIFIKCNLCNGILYLTLSLTRSKQIVDNYLLLSIKLIINNYIISIPPFWNIYWDWYIILFFFFRKCVQHLIFISLFNNGVPVNFLNRSDTN